MRALLSFTTVTPDDEYRLRFVARFEQYWQVTFRCHRPTLYTAILFVGVCASSRLILPDLPDFVDLNTMVGYAFALATLALATLIGKAIEVATRSSRTRQQDCRIHEARGPRIMTLILHTSAVFGYQAIHHDAWNAATCALTVCLVATALSETVYLAYGQYHPVREPRRHRVRRR